MNFELINIINLLLYSIDSVRFQNLMSDQLLSCQRILVIVKFIRLNHKIQHNEHIFWFSEYIY